MDRFETLTAFVAVADLKGFAPAARRLRLSPSAVTRLVADLENRLGIRLLQRTTRSVTLTDAGARYLQRARQVLADLAEADESAQAERATPAGRFVVTAPAVFGRLHVSPLMVAYLGRHPGVTGELQLTDRVVNLVEDGIDLAVRIAQLEDSSLVVRRLGETRRVVAGSPGYLARRGIPAEPGEVASHDIIAFAGLAGVGEWHFVADGRDRRVPIAPRYITNSADAAVAYAVEGGGLTMVLGYQVVEAVRAGRLSLVLSAFEPPPLPIQLVYPATRLLSAKVRAFIDLAVERCDWRFSEL